MGDRQARRRSRYAPDEQVRRALRLAKEGGLTPAGLSLGADGSVLILDSGAASALPNRQGDLDADLAAWESQNGLTGSA